MRCTEMWPTYQVMPEKQTPSPLINVQGSRWVYSMRARTYPIKDKMHQGLGFVPIFQKLASTMFLYCTESLVTPLCATMARSRKKTLKACERCQPLTGKGTT